MKDRDDLFDSKIKEKLRVEHCTIPEEINKKIDDTLENLNKRKFNYKKVAGICATCITGVMIFGVTMPTYASNIPLIGGIFESFNEKRLENYDKYASDINITKEYNGINVTINKVVYDGLDLDIFYSIESDKELEGNLDIWDSNIKINNKAIHLGGGSYGEFTDDNKTYIGRISYSVNSNGYVPKELEKQFGGEIAKKIPEEFILKLNIKSLGTKETKGKWNFEIPVSSELVKGKVKEIDCDIDLGNICEGTEIKKVITTPINTSIQGVYKGYYGDVDFIVFDDKGRYLEMKSGSGRGETVNGEYVSIFSYEFKEAYEDSKSITVIPYVDRIEFANSDLDIENDIESSTTISNEEDESVNTKETQAIEESTAKIVMNLNLDKDTVISQDNKKTYSTIKKVEVGNGKTKIYYTSPYSIYGAPYAIVDNKTGEEITTTGRADDIDFNAIEHLKESNEYVVTFEKELEHDDYSVVLYDQSKAMKVFYDNLVTIDIK